MQNPNKKIHSNGKIFAREALTLIELLMVLVILTALALVAVPRITSSQTTAKQKACNTNLDILNTQIELYYANEGTWPASLGAVTGDGNYFPDGAPTCPSSGSYSMNDSTYRCTCDASGH